MVHSAGSIRCRFEPRLGLTGDRGQVSRRLVGPALFDQRVGDVVMCGPGEGRLGGLVDRRGSAEVELERPLALAGVLRRAPTLEQDLGQP